MRDAEVKNESRLGWLAPLASVICGASLMFVEGAPASRWVVHLATAALAVPLVLLFRACVGSPRRRSITAVLLVVSVALTLVAAGLDGVHRWVGVGPIRLHVSALATPVLLVLAASSSAGAPRTRRGMVLLVLLLQVLHLLQPDAAQATALALGACWLVVSRRGRRPVVMAGVGGVLLIAAVTWLRADPLQPVAFVEDIAFRAADRGAAWLGAAAATMAVFVLSPMLVVRGLRARSARSVDATPAWALTTYFAAASVAPLVGAFPMPMLGYSPSPLLGTFLGLVALKEVVSEAAGVSSAHRQPKVDVGGNTVERHVLVSH